MPTPDGNWGAAEEQPKPAIDNQSWAGKDNTTEPNYDGWGTLAEHPNPVASKRGWKAVFSRKSSYNVKNEAYCMTCKKSFSSTTQLGKHACEVEDGHLMSTADENTMPTIKSSDNIHSDKPNDKEEGETTGNGWENAKNNVSTESNFNGRGIWSAAEDNATHQDTAPDEKDVDDRQCGDLEYDEPSDQDIHLAPTPAWKNRPKRNVHTSPYKERFEALVDQGWLTSGEIELLYTCEGRDLITHLRHFELVGPMMNIEEPCTGVLETQITHEYPYDAVRVLLLQWEEDDLGVYRVIYKLMAIFRTLFGFQSAEFFHIPSKRSYEALETRLQEFKQKYSFEKNLLIVYYAGHGYLDVQNRMHWAAKRLLPCPTLDWYALQVGLERTVSDVLILLDACCSARASNHVNPFGAVTGGRTEMIVASGFDQTTSGLSFTAALIGELKRMAKAGPNYDVCISAVQLHQRLLASMLHQSLLKEDDPGAMIMSFHRFSTPVYISLSRDHHQPSIPLKRFKIPPPPPPSVGSSINNPPGSSWRHGFAEDREGSKATDHHDCDKNECEDDNLWRIGTPPSVLFSERWNPRSGKMEVEAAEEHPITESMRTWLLESEELTRTERKQIKNEPVISSFTFHVLRVTLERRRRLARQIDARLSLSSNMA